MSGVLTYVALVGADAIAMRIRGYPLYKYVLKAGADFEKLERIH
jgi:hypothetical protein